MIHVNDVRTQADRKANDRQQIAFMAFMSVVGSLLFIVMLCYGSTRARGDSTRDSFGLGYVAHGDRGDHGIFGEHDGFRGGAGYGRGYFSLDGTPCKPYQRYGYDYDGCHYYTY